MGLRRKIKDAFSSSTPPPLVEIAPGVLAPANRSTFTGKELLDMGYPGLSGMSGGKWVSNSGKAKVTGGHIEPYESSGRSRRRVRRSDFDNDRFDNGYNNGYPSEGAGGIQAYRPGRVPGWRNSKADRDMSPSALPGAGPRINFNDGTIHMGKDAPPSYCSGNAGNAGPSHRSSRSSNPFGNSGPPRRHSLPDTNNNPFDQQPPISSLTHSNRYSGAPPLPPAHQFPPSWPGLASSPRGHQSLPPPARPGKVREGDPLPTDIFDPLATQAARLPRGHHGLREHLPGMTKMDIGSGTAADNPQANWKLMDDIQKIANQGGGDGGRGRRSGRRSGRDGGGEGRKREGGSKYTHGPR
jgi:hypothetical protein